MPLHADGEKLWTQFCLQLWALGSLNRKLPFPPPRSINPPPPPCVYKPIKNRPVKIYFLGLNSEFHDTVFVKTRGITCTRNCRYIPNVRFIETSWDHWVIHGSWKTVKKDKTAIILEVYNKSPKFINLALESQYIAVIYVNVTYAVANNKECRAKSSRDSSVRRFAVQPDKICLTGR